MKAIKKITRRVSEPFERIRNIDAVEVSNAIQGAGLNALTKLASSDIPDQLKMRKQMEHLLYEGSKVGFGFMAKQLSSGGSKGELSPEQVARKKKGLFDLSLSDEQKMVRESLRAFSKEVIAPAAHDADHDHQTPSEILDQLSELGIMYYAIPEAFGGMSDGEDAESTVTQMLSLEDLGFGDFSIGATAFSSVSVANVINRYGSREQKKTYLPQFLSDSPLKATMATIDSKGESNPYKLKSQVKKTGSLLVLTGEKSLVIGAKDAEVFVVSAIYQGKPELFLVDANAQNIKIKDDPAMGLKPAATCTVQFNGVRLLDSDRLPNLNYQQFIDLSHMAVCALACGVGDAVLDYVIPYVNDREAFGEPISHRQSVAFMVSDLAIELESMRMLNWRATSRAQSGANFHREAHLAYVLTCEKAMKIGVDAVQLLGGHGYTKEHPVERWYRDLRALPMMHGSLCL